MKKKPSLWTYATATRKNRSAFASGEDDHGEWHLLLVNPTLEPEANGYRVICYFYPQHRDRRTILEEEYPRFFQALGRWQGLLKKFPADEFVMEEVL